MTKARMLLRLLQFTLMTGGAVFFISLLLRIGPGSSEAAPAYQTAEATRGSLERTVSSTGTLAAVETVEVGTEVSGTMQRVLVDFNDSVRKGQVLAEIRQDLFTASVREGEAAVARAEAELEVAQRELMRFEALFDAGYISEQEFLPARLKVAQARASLVSAQAVLKRGETNLGSTVIRSPIDGTIIQRSVDAGQTVAASLNTPTLFLIARDLSRMRIEAKVDETDIGLIRQGQEVRFTVQSYPDQTFSGTVRQIRLQPEVLQNVVTYTVIVDALNEGGSLMPGMTATVDFVIERVEDALLVPSAALRFSPPSQGEENAPRMSRAMAPARGDRLFRLDEGGQLHPVPVTSGSSDGRMTVVAGEEIHEGMQVVTGLVRPRENPSSGTSLFRAMQPGRPGR
jgi:HlyD family secretion protein